MKPIVTFYVGLIRVSLNSVEDGVSWSLTDCADSLRIGKSKDLHQALRDVRLECDMITCLHAAYALEFQVSE